VLAFDGQDIAEVRLYFSTAALMPVVAADVLQSVDDGGVTWSLFDQGNTTSGFMDVTMRADASAPFALRFMDFIQATPPNESEDGRTFVGGSVPLDTP